jgi:hypothetical protein
MHHHLYLMVVKQVQHEAAAVGGVGCLWLLSVPAAPAGGGGGGGSADYQHQCGLGCKVRLRKQQQEQQQQQHTLCDCSIILQKQHVRGMEREAALMMISTWPGMQGRDPPAAAGAASHAATAAAAAAAGLALSAEGLLAVVASLSSSNMMLGLILDADTSHQLILLAPVLLPQCRLPDQAAANAAAAGSGPTSLTAAVQQAVQVIKGMFVGGAPGPGCTIYAAQAVLDHDWAIVSMGKLSQHFSPHAYSSLCSEWTRMLTTHRHQNFLSSSTLAFSP